MYVVSTQIKIGLFFFIFMQSVYSAIIRAQHEKSNAGAAYVCFFMLIYFCYTVFFFLDISDIIGWFKALCKSSPQETITKEKHSFKCHCKKTTIFYELFLK